MGKQSKNLKHHLKAEEVCAVVPMGMGNVKRDEVRRHLLHTGKPKEISIAQHRDNKALGGSYGNADIGEVSVDDLIAVNDCVHRRDQVQSVCSGLHKGRHEAKLDPMLLDERFLQAGSMRSFQGHQVQAGG